ncbi:DUF1499 domain-containing protein [Umezakia ovalisporum]|uniref:DUF1499 domain-containing protein n=1 Tax=Umezakia ovalisporum FSS-43 TaxID=2740520 RepID=A0ABT6K7Q5_9CYAN|nr:DUF1499 domain-containing protein [Umezakia ovalisporum]MDH6058105.1 DUF1499 domain-containing protein [Umezakia ovalisporum FSS-43]MDH6066652.1 DUF1499 domain-containing protein [Umezakia ovalisporum APH033B]MDH6071596.1 DUF1499 domain-containing protein [Umezakia ovalisporum CobakiLakeA]MDH6080936.1 DUF1499 domain-containing protein [Umezakia ovalisporum FSS-44]MDH6096514.1 DUF1499 domain-containing protein [Umezakia ovalisporum CobakiLakeB]
MSHLLTALTKSLWRRITLIIFLTLISGLIVPTPTWAESSSLGIHNGYLSPCPPSNNCVLSQNPDAKHAIDPITYHVHRDKARGTLLQVLSVVPRTEVIEQTDNYIHALCKSRIFKFIDDVEFYLPTNESVIHARSASRIGESDLGVNRRRVEQIRLALRDLNI